MSEQAAVPRTAYRPLVVLLGCVLVMAIAMTWTFVGMRAVMDVGGSCAEGGPYEVAQTCPDGAWLLSLAIPVMVAVALLGSYLAFRLSAPNLLLPMWLLLFGSLGWNFLEYGFGDDGPVWGWVVCGVVFELMALPALGVMVAGDKLVRIPTLPGQAAGSPRQLVWYASYVVLGVAGAVVGWWSFDALS
jgi:hypothetical protein